jgi:hypothetical protein
MPTVRGFVQRLEVGRAGLVTIVLLHADGSSADYIIPDLDADPERFNEYLSKLGIMRDAMDRAEPVEVEYDQKEGSTRSLARVARITRDQLAADETQRVAVSVVGVVIGTAVGTGGHMESADLATIVCMAADGSVQRYVLDMQIPERAVAQAQLGALLHAQEDGAVVTLEVTTRGLRIVAVGVGNTDEQGDGGGTFETSDGFVESIRHSPFATGLSGTALVMLTTAPPFNGAGNMVPLLPFTPQPLALLVAAGSAEYKLFVLALAEKLRVRVMLGGTKHGDKAVLNQVATSRTLTKMDTSDANAAADEKTSAFNIGNLVNEKPMKPLLVRGAKVLHALCSASRPVWIEVRRRSLDLGPEATCTEGVPTSDLSVRTIRDLHLPYGAEWVGLGCFNHGVYRFQFGFASPFEIFVDGEALCVHTSPDGKTRFAHACLDGDHEVRVALSAWTCAQVFDMDVYRIR